MLGEDQQHGSARTHQGTDLHPHLKPAARVGIGGRLVQKASSQRFMPPE